MLFLSLPQDRPVGLIKILKDEGPVWTVLQRLQVDVRQELETCFLALAGGEEQLGLLWAGADFTVIERNARSKEFFLVPLDAPEALGSLRDRGRAEAVEPGTAVFWTEDGSSAGALPPDLPRKPLPVRTVLPYLGTPVIVPGTSSVPFSWDPLIGQISGRASESGLRSLVQSLQDFQTRYASTPNCEAAGDFIHDTFSSLGLDEVRFEPFTFSGGYKSRNVIAEKTGKVYPRDILIICGHYDSTSPAATRQTLAPGADDNASGTAAVIEAARALSPFPLDFTVRFIAFSAEEWGLYGSRDYADKARATGESILGVINLDMIAYADALPEELEVIVNAPSEWLAERLAAAATLYADLEARKRIDASIVYSDHAPFWDRGYHALLAIEDHPLQNPYYHKTTDTIDKLHFGFFLASARASLALLAELAQPVREGHPRTPAGLTAKPIVYRSLFQTAKSARLSWSAQGDAVGYNIYRTSLSHVDYLKLNPTLITATTYTDGLLRTDLPYFYAVTAVGFSGLESNRSKEASVAPESPALTVPAQWPGSIQILRVR